MKKVFFAAIAAMVMVSVSNVFASNKKMGNSSAVPVDTVAPTTPTDSTVTDTPVTPQAGSEDDTTKQETPTETNTETPVESVDDTKKQTPVQEENTTQEETSENQQPTTEQNIVSTMEKKLLRLDEKTIRMYMSA